MRSSVFAKWVRAHPFQAHIALPGLMSLALIALYFSGSLPLQNIVAPNLPQVEMFSRREFGALEMLQNFILLCVIFFALRGFIAARGTVARKVALLLLIGAVFVFAEEIDYGRHFLEYLRGERPSLDPATWNRNVHNLTVPATGVQIGDYLKLGASIGGLLVFVLAPLILHDSRNRTVRLLLPSRWIIWTVVLTVALSRLAHTLDDLGIGSIGGVPGVLHGNISEFRELNIYYVVLMYAADLHERILTRRQSPAPGEPR